MKRTATGAGWIIAWRLATRNLGLMSTLILVRLLEPADFGLVAIATGFIATADALSWIGVQDALLRHPERSKGLYDTGFTLNVLRGVVTAGIVLLIAWPVASFFDEPRLVPVLYALALGIVMTGAENIGTVNFRRDMDFDKEFHLQVWPRLAGVLVTIGAAILMTSYWALIIGLLATRLVRLVQSYVMSSYRPRFGLSEWRAIVGFSFWSWLCALLSQVRDRADQMVLGRMMGTSAVGMFSIGVEIGSLTTTELMEPLHRALFSGFTNQRGDADDQSRMFITVVGIAVMIVLPVGVGISLVADPIIRLVLGERWLDIRPIIQVASIGATVTVFGTVASALLLSHGKPNLTFWLLARSLSVRVPAMIAGVHWWGLTGAAIALVITQVVDQVFSLRTTLPLLGVPLRRVLVPCCRPVLACAAMASVMVGLGFGWTEGTATGVPAMIGELLLRSGTGAVVYVATIGGLWWACGRPEGAERHVLGVVAVLWRRVTGRRSP